MKKKYRIRKNEEFQAIIKRKRFYASSTFVLYVVPKKEKSARIGLSVSKKIGNAVVRNKVKRQLRMQLQDCFNIHGDFDAIIIVRKRYLQDSFEVNKKDLETLLKKVRI